MMEAQYNELNKQMQEQAKESERKQAEMMKIIEKKNYESHYQVPEAIRNHNKKYPNSFNIQVKVFNSDQTCHQNLTSFI